jgi:multidrug resistance efflux pump
MNTKKLFGLMSLFLATGFILSACGSSTAEATQNVQPTPVSSSVGSALVIAEGRIVPRDSANLFFLNGGKVDEVLVKEGDSVTKGTVLTRLGDRDTFLANVAAAQAEVTSAQQALNDLNRTAGLAYNQSVLDEISAEKAYYEALKAWDDFDQNQYDNDLDQAKADVADAKKALDDARDEFNKYASLDKNNTNRKSAKTALDNAQTKYDDALSKQSDIENKYRKVKSDLDLAQARLDEARRTRENRKEGADKDELALAQARLDAANARLRAAQTALDNLDIVAPYDGIVARVDVSAGEEVNPGQVVMVFADTSEWFVETTDLTENEIVNIREGMEAVVVPDALPNLELKGSVESIANVFIEKAGDITYRVRVKLEDVDPRLKWGMTTETRFTEPSK